MRLYELLKEGYKEAQSEFSTVSGPDTVRQVIDLYKQLVTKNQVQGNERNIDWWRRQGWDAFNKFVSTKAAVPTKTDVKRQKILGKSITLKEDNEWLIVIPLNKEASCFHGKNSDWCTTKPNQPFFEEYFYDRNVTLIYCLNKKTTGMWAIAYHNDIDQVGIFDQQDNSINQAELAEQTGLDAQELIALVETPVHKEKISGSRDTFNDKLKELRQLLNNFDYIKRDEHIEQLLTYIKKPDLCLTYIRQIYQEHGKQSYPAGLELAAISEDGDVIRYIKNPSEQVQLAAVKKHGSFIRQIANPSEKIQLAAVSTDPGSLEYIRNPSENVKMIAVGRNPMAIKYIDNPSEEIQLVAVKKHPRSISEISFPSEKVQMAAVQGDYKAFRYIEDPSEAVQLLVIETAPELIRYVHEPSEAVQMLAISIEPNTLAHIKNPTERVQMKAVTENQEAIQYIDNPYEKVQLEAIADGGLRHVIRYIKNPCEKVQMEVAHYIPGALAYFDSTEKVQLYAIKKFPKAFKFIKNPYPSAKELYQELENNATIPPN